MVHSLLACEFEAAGEPIYRVLDRLGRQLLVYAPIVSEESRCHPGDAAASWSRTLQKSCGTIVWPYWPRSWREVEYGLYLPWSRRQFVRMCRDAIRRGAEAIVCEEPIRFDALAAQVPSLASSFEDIKRVLPRLDVLSRLCLRWVYLVGFSDPSTAWTLLQTDDATLTDAVLAEAEGVGAFKVIQRHPSTD
jgi:hypothetical protein